MISRHLALVITSLAIAVAGPAVAHAQPQNAVAFGPPPSGKGKIVFFRADARGVGCLVREGEGAAEVRLSKLTNNRYFVHVADAGPHRYWAKNLSKDAVNLEVEAGETYFVRCDIAVGMMSANPNPNLSSSSAQEFDAVKGKLQPMTDK